MKTNPKLTPDQVDSLKNKATEAPFTGEYLHNDKQGMYSCANCGAELFASSTKFDSGSGWPSFFDVAKSGAVKLVEDSSLDMKRVEAVCATCNGHLGHVFDDAYDQPTGLRYCVNSSSLDFKETKK